VNATRLYKRALVHNPVCPSTWYNLGVHYATLSAFEDAIISYEMAINFNPNFAQAFNNLAV